MAPHADRLQRYSLRFQPSSLLPQRSQTPKGQKEPLRCAMLQYSASKPASCRCAQEPRAQCLGLSETPTDPGPPAPSAGTDHASPQLLLANTAVDPSREWGSGPPNLQMKMAEEPRSAKRHVLRDGSRIEHSWPSRDGSRRGRIEPHLTDEETEAQGGKVTCPRSQVR